MSPANGHANDSANIPTTAVQQFAPPASDTNIPTALTPNAAKIKELIANLEVPFHPSVIEWRVTNTICVSSLVSVGHNLATRRSALARVGDAPFDH